jgi:benzoyl-CoA reductase/2-hydroxyglutaryl-CoA dehydratase subunit BcrC/BadD/HgdB
MEEKNVLLLAVGDGAINIVEQNKEKLSEQFAVATIRKDGNQEFDAEQWASMLRLIVPNGTKHVCVLNCLGGDDAFAEWTVTEVLTALSESLHNNVYLTGAFVFPFSFEGNSRYATAYSKMMFIENEIYRFQLAKKFFNDDMFLHFPNLTFDAALRKFNEEICDGIIAHVQKFVCEHRPFMLTRW